MGFNLDPVQPEDIRFDWNIVRPEDFWRSKRVQHRVYMDRDEAGQPKPAAGEPAKDSPAVAKRRAALEPIRTRLAPGR